jgi:hypothetical protein
MKWRPPAISLVWIGTLAFFLAEMPFWWMYAYRWYDRESIQFFATVVAGSFALFAYLKGIETSRDREAGKFIERWNSPDLRSIVNRSRPLVEQTVKSENYARPQYDSKTATADQTQLRGDIITILGMFEEIAIAVAQKHASEDRIKEFFGAVIPGGYDGFQAFILSERKQDKEDYYMPTQRLVERWTRKKRPDMLP